MRAIMEVSKEQQQEAFSTSVKEAKESMFEMEKSFKDLAMEKKREK
jgi:hypothetical protein